MSQPSFMTWLKSTKSILAKLLLLISIIWLSFILVQANRQHKAKAERDQAYRALQALEPSGSNMAEVAKLTEHYLLHPPVLETDRRISEVAKKFEVTFANWYMETEEIDPAELNDYQATYYQITAKK